MGLFDFFKSKPKESEPKEEKNTQNNEEQTVKHELHLTDKDLRADEETVDRIVEKMIEEDPFKNVYSGKTKDDFTPLSNPVYKYEAVTTVNVDLVTRDKGKVLVKIENMTLGFLPEKTAETVQSYQEKYMLTAFVYVTGGPYMMYDPKVEEAIEEDTPFGLDIYIQFT